MNSYPKAPGTQSPEPPAEGEAENTEEAKDEAEGIPEGVDVEQLLRHCLTIGNISDFGLQFFFEIVKELVINRDFIEALYRTIVKIASKRHATIEELPAEPTPAEEGQEVTEEEKKEWEKRCEEIKVQNAENEKTNEEIAKF